MQREKSYFTGTFREKGLSFTIDSSYLMKEILVINILLFSFQRNPLKRLHIQFGHAIYS